MTEGGYECRTVAVLVNVKGEAMYEDGATKVAIDDEAAGEFVTVSQHTDASIAEIRITPEEWPTLREAIDRMIAECRA